MEKIRYASTVKYTPSEARRKWVRLGIYSCNIKASGEAGAARCARRPSLIAAGAAAGFARRRRGQQGRQWRGVGFVPRVWVRFASGCSPGAQNAPTSPPYATLHPHAPPLRPPHAAPPALLPAPPPHSPPAAAPAAPEVRCGERSEPPRLPPPPLHLYRLLSICNLRRFLLFLLLHLCNLRRLHL